MPPIESLISIVKGWLRYGTCFAPEVSAEMTSPRADRLLLMDWSSFIWLPLASVLDTRSDPARSTRVSLPMVVTLVVWQASGGWVRMMEVGCGGGKVVVVVVRVALSVPFYALRNSIEI